MVSLSTWCRYIAHKVTYSITFSRKISGGCNISDSLAFDLFLENLLLRRLTYMQRCKGQSMPMAPTIGGEGQQGSLLVRKLPEASPMTVFVGDVVLLKDPEIPGSYIIRRLAAIEGCEMASSDEKDEPFVLKNGQCWVLSDNEALKPEEARTAEHLVPYACRAL